MSWSIALRPRARADLDEQVDYLLGRNPAAAQRFADAVEALIQLLAAFPEMGTLGSFANPLAAGVRWSAVRGFKQHLVFYRPTENGIEVVRVLHAARDIEALFGSEQGP